MDRMRVLQGPLQIIYKNILILFVIFARIPFLLYLSFFVYFSPYTPLLPSRIYLFFFISLTHSQLNCLCWFMFPVPLVGSSVNAHKHLNWNLTCEGKSHIRMSTKLFPSIQFDCLLWGHCTFSDSSVFSLKSSPWPKYTKYETIFPQKIMFYYQTFFLLQICSLLYCS